MPRQTKLLGARRSAPQQIDLFAGEPWTAGDMPAWSGLPAQSQAALIELMTRLNPGACRQKPARLDDRGRP